MKTVRMAGLSLILTFAMTVSGWAAFAPPTADQLAGAAADPGAQLAALLTDATAAEAAGVLGDVLALIADMEMTSADRTARIAAAMQSALAALPPAQHEAFVLALSDGMAASPSLSPLRPDVRAGLTQPGNDTLVVVFDSVLPDAPPAPLDVLPPQPPKSDDPPPQPPPADDDDGDPPPPPPPAGDDDDVPPPAAPIYPGQSVP